MSLRQFRVKHPLLIIVLLGFVTSVSAEINSQLPRNVQFSSLNTELGFSSEFVHDAEQDKLGFMWFATQAGLNRFDGHKVRVFENFADDPDSLSHNFVWDILPGDNDEIWLGTERGVNLYSHQSDKFIREPFDFVSLANYRVRQIARDDRGVFWLGTLGDGLLKINPANQEFSQFAFNESDSTSIPNNHVMALLIDQRGELWVGTDGGGLARFDAGTERFVRYASDNGNKDGLSDNRIRRVYQDGRGQLWVGTAAGGLNLFDPDVGLFAQYLHDPQDELSLPAGQVSAIFEDSFGTLWVGTESGLAEWRPALPGFVRYEHDVTNRSSLVSNRVNVITQDVSGVLWIGTHNGISSWNYLSDTFAYYRSQDGYLKSDLVTQVAETSRGELWVGTYGGGLSSIDPQTGEVTHYLNSADPKSLSDDRVMAVNIDRDDRIWVGTRGEGLLRKNANGPGFEKFTQDANNPFSLSSNAITSIMQDKAGGLWVGTFGGGLNYSADARNPEFVHYMHNPDDPASISGNRVLAIYEDRAGFIWVGTEGDGLNRLDPNSRQFARFNLDPSDENGDRPRGTPWEILETPDRTLWIGTLGQGLFRWEEQDRGSEFAGFKQYSSAQGLASDIYAVVPGVSGELWLSSNRGLFEFDIEAGQGRKFDRNNGLLGNEFSQGARLKSRSGRLLFGSNQGLVSFFPGDVPNNERVPVVSIEVNSRTDLLANTWTGGEIPKISLEYFDAFIAFDFVALDFVSPDKNEYRYRLAGLDNEWNVARDYRQAIYSSLSPGNYTFQVEASNNDGVWNRHKTEVEVTVVPPPWSSWWAYLIYGLIALGAVLLLVNRQRAKALAEAEARQRLEQLVSERTAELADRNTELMSLNDQLEHASVTDALTGLRNRRFVDEHMESELSKLRRSMFESGGSDDHPSMLFLMMVDLDGFKTINDRFGHQAGDLALLGVKDRLLATCRKSDVVVRWGGDEFLIIGHANTLAGIEQFVEKIRVCLKATPYDVGDGNFGELSGSIGVAPMPFIEGKLNFASWEQICRVSDMAAYLAKDSGRDGWVSIVGAEGFTSDDLVDLRENLSGLLEQKKLRLRSSRSLSHIL